MKNIKHKITLSSIGFYGNLILAHLVDNKYLAGGFAIFALLHLAQLVYYKYKIQTSL